MPLLMRFRAALGATALTMMGLVVGGPALIRGAQLLNGNGQAIDCRKQFFGEGVERGPHVSCPQR
jgi:hypothetical protein